MALSAAAVVYSLREVALRDKPLALLEASPKGTVPVLVLPDEQVIDESLDIMRWALTQNDPGNWLANIGRVDLLGKEFSDLIATNDSPFKYHLDRMKYANRYPGTEPAQHRAAAEKLLATLDERLRASDYLIGNAPAFADVALFPFVRQFAHADASAFDELPMPHLKQWLSKWESSAVFQSVMARPS
jgi:glutathione S-transferase